MKTLSQLSEAVEKHHVTAFTRMNPPTTGHMQLIDKVHEVAKDHDADHSVVVSHSQDPKKNPLSSDQKKKHLKRFSPETNVIASSKEHPTILHHLAALHKAGVTHLHLVAGSDRHDEMHKLINTYNGKKAGHGYYNFKKITIHSAGERDPDAEGTSGISATKQREHAAAGNFKEFRKGVPDHVSDAHAKDLMNDVRNGQKTKKNEESEMESLDNLFEEFMIEDSQSFSDEEMWNVINGMHSHELDPNENDVEFVDILIGESYEEDIDESRVLSIAQRQRAKMKFKSRQPRLKRMREIKRKRMATPQRLQYRARTSALMMLRKRIAGAKGLAYHTLSPSQRYSIDKAVQQRFGKNLDKLVGTISKRTLPMIRKKEMARLAKARGQKTSSIIGPQTMTQSYDVSEAPDYISTNNDHLLTPKVNMLLRLGLVDQDEIERYRRALKIGEKALSSPELRGKILSMLDKTLKLATDDPQTFARIRAMVVLRKNSQNEQNSLEVNPLEIDPLQIDKTDPTPDQGHSQHLTLRKKMIRQNEAVNPAAAAQKAQNAQKTAALRQQKIQRSLKQKAFTEKQRREKEQFNASTGKPQKKFSSMKTKTSGVSSLGGIAAAAAFGGDREMTAAVGNAVHKGYGWLKKKLTAEYDPLAEDKIVESLYKKSMKYNISIDTVVEVYEAALKDSGNENVAFDAVNSFLANQQEAVNEKDSVVMDIPLLIRVLELAREDLKSDMDLHKVVEKLINIRNKGILTMDDYDYIAHIKEQVEQMDEVQRRADVNRVKVRLPDGSIVWRNDRRVIAVQNEEVELMEEDVDADSIFEIEMYVPEIHEARGDHLLTIQGGRGKGRKFMHKDTSVDDHLSAMEFHLKGYHAAKKDKLDATKNHHAKMYHKHKDRKDRIEALGEKGNHLKESNAHKILAQKIQQMAIRKKMTDDALARHNAEQEKAEKEKKQGVAEGFFSGVKHAFTDSMKDVLKERIPAQHHKHYDIDSVKSLSDGRAIYHRARAAGHMPSRPVKEGVAEGRVATDALTPRIREETLHEKVEARRIGDDGKIDSRPRVKVHIPGHKIHGKVAYVYHDHGNGKIDTQIHGPRGGYQLYTLHSKQYKHIKEETVAEASNRMRRYGQQILKRAKAARDAEARDAEANKEKPQTSTDTSSTSTRDLLQQLRRPNTKKKRVSEEGGAGEFGTPELTKKYAKDTPGQCQEILNMNTADMGDVIKDFKKSDAPQFKGKSVEKRRQMAIAAKLSSQNKE
jgi:hypothetical protein